MTTDFHWRDALLHHLETSWLDLLELTAACGEANLTNPSLTRFELLSLGSRIGMAKDGDPAQLEACLAECARLLAYYGALVKQKQRVEATGSAFSQRALERLLRVRNEVDKG